MLWNSRQIENLQHLIKIVRVFEPFLGPEGRHGQLVGDLSLIPASENDQILGGSTAFRKAIYELENFWRVGPRVESTEAMHLVRGKNMPRKKSQHVGLKDLEVKNDWRILFSAPQKPLKVNLKTRRLPELQKMARLHALSDKGSKMDVVQRLEALNASRFETDMENYERAVSEHIRRLGIATKGMIH